MEIRLLKKDFLKKEEFYKDFLDDKIIEKDEYFSDEVVHINNAPDFPIYMGKGSEEEKAKLFMKAFEAMSNFYLNTDRDIHMNERFWYTLLCVHKRDFVLKMYPQVGESIKDFHNIVLKKFDWEKVEDFITKVMTTTNVDAAYTLTGTYIAVSQTPDNVEYWKAMGRFVGIISDVLYGAPVILEKAVGGALIIAREAVKSKPAEINK